MGRELRPSQKQTNVKFKTSTTTRILTASACVEAKHIRAVDIDSTLENPEIAP